MKSFEGDTDWYSDAGEQGWGHKPPKRRFMGVLGEMAFATHYDIQIDTETYFRTDGGIDFNVRIAQQDFADGTIGVDVKSSLVENPDLMVKTESVDADYYVQCRLPDGLPESDERTTIEMMGGATKKMLLNREARYSLKYDHYNYHVSPEYLLDLPGSDEIKAVE